MDPSVQRTGSPVVQVLLPIPEMDRPVELLLTVFRNPSSSSITDPGAASNGRARRTKKLSTLLACLRAIEDRGDESLKVVWEKVGEIGKLIN